MYVTLYTYGYNVQLYSEWTCNLLKHFIQTVSLNYGVFYYFHFLERVFSL